MGKYLDEYYQKHCLPIECPICGKKFIPAPEHYWKIGNYGMESRDERVCSYSCMRKWEKEQEAEIKAKKNKRARDYSSEAISLIKSRMPNETYERFVELRYGLHYSLRRIADTLGYEKRQIERYSVKVQNLISAMDDIKDGHIVYE
jgi:hypothetical protein